MLDSPNPILALLLPALLFCEGDSLSEYNRGFAERDEVMVRAASRSALSALRIQRSSVYRPAGLIMICCVEINEWCVRENGVAL